jgi:hypothetical protein
MCGLGCGLSISGGGRPQADRSRGSGELGGVFRGASITEFTVGPLGVVLDAEVLDDAPRPKFPWPQSYSCAGSGH